MAASGRRGLGLLLLVWAFAVAVLAAPMAFQGTLPYNDNLLLYSFFFNNLHSLNTYGEPAWWFPNTQMGYPGYFFSIVSITDCGMPAFAAIGFVVWLLGRVGVTLTRFHALYVFYFGALIPLLYLVGVWLVARQVFRSPLVVSYLLIAAAFSPGVLTSMTDLGGLEHTAYTLYFVAAALRFLRRPVEKRSILLLGVCACLLGLSANYLFLVTTAPLLLCFAMVLGFHRSFRRALARGRLGLSWTRGALLAALVLVGALPNLITWAQKGDLIQRDAEGLAYTFSELKGGNPWEVLLASTPAVGFEWDQYLQHQDGRPNRYEPGGHFKGKDSLSYGYLGLLAWPLALWGLLFGRARLRVGLLAGLALLFAILLLQSYSAAFALLLAPRTPLQGMNHFCDLLYRDGGFLVLLFAAGLGLERVQKARGPGIAGLFALVAFLSVGVTAALHDFDLSMATGFPVLVAILMGILLFWQGRSPLAAERRVCLVLLVGLALVDVSTTAWWYARLRFMRQGWKVTDELYPDGLGIGQSRPNRRADQLLHFARMARLTRSGLPIEELPFAALYPSAHFHGDDPTRADFDRALGRGGEPRSLALAADPAGRASLGAVFRGGGREAWGEASLEEKTYNSMRLAVRAQAPALLFVRDAFSPYWRAKVNGDEAAVHAALGAFKAVAVPAGDSEVVLRFAPFGLAASLALAYSVLLALAVLVPLAR